MYNIRKIKINGLLKYWVYCEDIHGNVYDTMYHFETKSRATAYIRRQLEIFAQ